MNKLISISYRISKMLPGQVLSKMAGMVKSKAKNLLVRNRDVFFNGTYTGRVFNSKLNTYFPLLSDKLDALMPEQTEQIKLLSDLYLNHYFDLLGSGWVRIEYGMKCRGLEGYRYDMGSRVAFDREGKWLAGRINRSNLHESRRIWQMIGDKDYLPIDWQLDFKSGYRWNEKTWYEDIKYEHKSGVDIKVPWELARMQHLPILAWAYGLAKAGGQGFSTPETYAGEFRNQVLDFIALNPPRFGVNWFCTMDVGIRAVNWLVAYDMFRSFGAEFDEEFLQTFAKSVYEHGKHCRENLEYFPKMRSNHYLSDIAGLIFCAAYLPSTETTDKWIDFAMQELVNEMEFQFNPDSTNFEASTSYHRLSTEIMLYCTMLCLNLPEDKRKVLKNKDSGIFPQWYMERLEKAIEFTRDITKPSGEIPQIGDNDSGRFLKIWPVYNKIEVGEAVEKYKNLAGYTDFPKEATYLDENILDHRHILGVGGVLFRREDFLSAAGSETPETILIKTFLGNKRLKYLSHQDNTSDKTIASQETVEEYIKHLTDEYGKPLATTFQGENLKEGLQIYAYPDFGLFIYKSKTLYLAIRCGSIGQKGKGGHSHNDQLSIELSINGREIIRDPGTYLYIPLQEKRDYFRSTKVHFTPFVNGREQNEMIGAFSMRQRSEPEVLIFNRETFFGKLKSRGGKEVCRYIKVQEEKIEIQDFFKGTASQHENNLYSNGYGKLLYGK